MREPPDIDGEWLDAILKSDADEVRLIERGDIDADVWRQSMGSLSARDDLALRQYLVDLGPRGRGDHTTIRALRAIFHDFGLGAGDGREYAERWNRSNGKPFDERELDRQIERCSREQPKPDDMTDREWRVKSVRGWSRGVAMVGACAQEWAENRRAELAAGRSDVAEEIERARSDLAQWLGRDSDLVPELLFTETAEDLLRREFPPTPWLVRGLVTQGGVAAIITHPKCGKTWAGTEIAIAAATGTRAFGQFETDCPKNVAYFYAEDVGRSVKNRIRALAHGRGDLSRFRPQPRGRYIDLCDLDHVALVLASCRSIGDVGLIVLDPMRDVHTGEENDSGAMSAVMSSLRALSQLAGCTVLLVHHSAKAGGARGSSAILGALDGILMLSGLETDGVSEFVNTVHPTVKGARSAGAFKLTLTVEDDANGEAVRATWSVSAVDDETSAPDAPTTDRDVDALVAYVSDHPGTPWSKVRTARIAPNGGCFNGQHLDAVRKRAVAQGKLFEEKIGKALVVRVIGGVP